MAMNIRFLSILLLSILFLGCRKNNLNPVPNIPFDLMIDISLPSYNSLNGVGGWCYVNGGSRGIIVYRRSIEEFVAFDRHSPEDPDGICPSPIFPDSNNFLQLNDTCNNSTFSLYDGMPISNSDFGLRQYATAFDGNSILRIYN
jgi:hypothetical protein